MIYVTNGQSVEPLIQISNFEMTQEIDGNFNISFISHNVTSNPAHSILQEESIVTVGDFDYRVKQMKETRNGKSVVALHTFFDLSDKRQNAIYGGTRTFNEFASFVFQDTGWTFTSDISGSRLIANFGEDNVVALVSQLCKVYQCEFQILPNNRVHFANQIGGDYDAQYRYGYNVKALSKNVDTTKLKTYIIGYGAITEGQGQLIVKYTSPYAERYGIREADPIYDERYTIAANLLEHLKSELIDYPEVTFELDSIELLDKELGERVWLIYEPLDMEFQTRILSQVKEYVNGELRTTKVTLGNTVPKSLSDILINQKVEIDENSKITRSKFEQTNDRITLEVEKIGVEIGRIEIKADNINLKVDRLNETVAEIDIKADQIELSVNNRITDEVAKINIRADSIESSVNNRITNEIASINMKADGIQLEVNKNKQDIAKIDIKADSISSTVSSQQTQIGNLNNRVGSAESSITQQAWQISQKVSTTDYNGNTISSLINQTSTSITIQASKIQLRGAVSVLSDITGNLGTITAGNINISEDIHMGRRLYFSDMTSVGGANGTIQLDAWNDIIYSGNRHSFYGIVDFSNANVVGMGGGSNYAYGHTSGIGIAYSSAARRLYVRINGSDVGYVTLT